MKLEAIFVGSAAMEIQSIVSVPSHFTSLHIYVLLSALKSLSGQIDPTDQGVPFCCVTSQEYRHGHGYLPDFLDRPNSLPWIAHSQLISYQRYRASVLKQS